MNGEFHKLWVDKEHGIVVIKYRDGFYYKNEYQSSTYERYLVYDFDRMNVTGVTTHVDKIDNKRITRYGKGKYDFIREITPFMYGYPTPEQINKKRNMIARTIIDALIQMFNRTFGHLFAFDFDALKLKKNYANLDLYLRLMWYLTQYPHVTYVVNDMPLLRQRLIRMCYTNSYSKKGNWSPDKVFKLDRLSPHEMLGLPKSTYKRLSQRIRYLSEPRYVMNMTKYMSTEELNALLDIPNIESRHLVKIDEIVYHPLPIYTQHTHTINTTKWVNKLVRSKHHALHKLKVIELVHKNIRTLVDHCMSIDIFDFSKLPTSETALREIIRRHAEEVRQRELARDIESHNKAQKRLDETSAKYKKITDMVIDDYEFVLLDSVKAFMDEGEIMDNCVSMYMHYEECLIISMRREQQPVVDIEYVLNTRTISQHLAKSNRKTTDKQNKIIDKWLKTVNRTLKKGGKHAQA